MGFVSDLRRHHVERNSYRLDGELDKLQVVPDISLSGETKIQVAKQLLEYSKTKTQSGFNDEEVRILSSCAFDAIRNLKDLPKVDSEEIKKLTEEATWNLMGHTEVPKSTAEQKELFDKIVIGNRIHYAVNRLHQMNQAAPLSLLINGKWVSLTDLTQEKVGEELLFKNAQGEILFKTKSDYTFNVEEYYYCGQYGIVKGNFYKDTMPIEKGYDKVENHDGKYYAEIHNSIVAKESFPRVIGARTSHAYLGLIDTDGTRTFCGEYAIFGNVNVMGSVHSDRARTKPFHEQHELVTRKEITKEQHDILKAQMVIDVQKGRLDPIDAEDNCTNYVSTRLRQAGVEIEGVDQWQTTLVNIGFRWLISSICPQSWYKPITDFVEDLPLFIKIPLHFFPPVYIVNVLLGLVQTLSGFYFGEGHHPLYNFKFLLKAIFCPWVPNIHHPIALARWQEKQTPV